MKSLEFLRLLTILASTSAQREAYEQLACHAKEYPLPALPFGFEELEPYLDAPTIRVHYLGHHQAYTNKMNAALKQWREQVSEYH